MWIRSIALSGLYVHETKDAYIFEIHTGRYELRYTDHDKVVHKRHTALLQSAKAWVKRNLSKVRDVRA
ncbi:MAG: hypothetical protein GY835_22665 [bacterium]|nr:hypothetical protein [bacterium]